MVLIIEGKLGECGILEVRGRKCFYDEGVIIILNVVSISIRVEIFRFIGFSIVEIIDVRIKKVWVV